MIEYDELPAREPEHKVEKTREDDSNWKAENMERRRELLVYWDERNLCKEKEK